MVGLNQGCSTTTSKAFCSAASAVFKSAEDCDLATNSAESWVPLQRAEAWLCLGFPLLFQKSGDRQLPALEQSNCPYPCPAGCSRTEEGQSQRCPCARFLYPRKLGESAVLPMGLPAWCACIEGRGAASFPTAWGYPGVRSLWETSKVSVKGPQRQASLLTRPQLTTEVPRHPCKPSGFANGKRWRAAEWGRSRSFSWAFREGDSPTNLCSLKP